MKETTAKLVTSWGKRTYLNTRYLFYGKKGTGSGQRDLITLRFLLAARYCWEFTADKAWSANRLQISAGISYSDCSASITRTATLFVILFVRNQTLPLDPWTWWHVRNRTWPTFLHR